MQRIVPSIAGQARELIVAGLPAAGRQFCRAERLPPVITSVLKQAIARTELNNDDRARLEGAVRRAGRRLGIHRSTLDCRLSRAARLAGISPANGQGILLFAAAPAAMPARRGQDTARSVDDVC